MQSALKQQPQPELSKLQPTIVPSVTGPADCAHIATALSASDPDFLIDLGYAYAVAGKKDKAQKILAELRRKRERGFVPSSALAIVYGALDEKDKAFAWLEKAYEERDPQLTYLKVGPRFDPLRQGPRFKEVLRRIGLAGNLPSSNTAN